MSHGVVENIWFLSDGTAQLSGWCFFQESNVKTSFENIRFNNSNIEIIKLSKTDRPDVKIEISDVGYLIQVKGEFTVLDFIAGRIQLIAESNNKEFVIKPYWPTLFPKIKVNLIKELLNTSSNSEVYEVIKYLNELSSSGATSEEYSVLELAEIIDRASPQNIEDTIKIISAEKRLNLLKVTESSFIPWPPLAHKKKRLAVITYANGAGAWFPYFYKYYSNIVGADSIFLITAKPEEFVGYELGGVISLKGLPFDNNPRVQLASKLTSGLLAYYDWVINCDVDEIVVPHPLSNLDFMETLADLKGDFSFARGFDVIQYDDEEAFDFDQDILSQRKFGIINSALCKPHIAKINLNYSPGYHFCQFQPYFEEKNKGFITLHLKFACNDIMKQVNSLVKSTSYASKITQNYATTSSSHDEHLNLKEARAYKAVSLDSEFIDNFETEFIEGFRLQTSTGFYIRDHFIKSRLVKLSS